MVCRHEQNAAFIAGGIGRMTGKAGVAIGEPHDVRLIAALEWLGHGVYRRKPVSRLSKLKRVGWLYRLYANAPLTKSVTTIAPLRANQSNIDLPINVMPFLCIAQS